MVRVRQASVCRPRSGARVPLTLYPSRRDLQPAPARLRQTACELPLERLPTEGSNSLQSHDVESSEFMRRFLLHVLPAGFHRIRHYGLLANPVRRANLAKIRTLLGVAR